jgi:galactokinase
MKAHENDRQLSVSEQAITGFKQVFDASSQLSVVSAPGRVNLIGEHIDYHGMPVMPIAIQKRIAIAFRKRPDNVLRAKSAAMTDFVELSLTPPFSSGEAGHWGNYARAATRTLAQCLTLRNGMDAYVASDLPSAAGLSSSSALLIGFTLALLQANGTNIGLTDLTSLLPDGEQFVGTRGGGMDHIAILASRAGFATLIRSFQPLVIDYVSIPADWRFLVAHSLVTAEKSGAVRAQYNAKREAGARALQKLGLASYAEAVELEPESRVSELTDKAERNAFLHVTSEARRVMEAATALRNNELAAFGRLLNESQASLRHRMHVSLPQLDRLIAIARKAGAAGARLTGAGFGGCVVCLCTKQTVERVRDRLVEAYYVIRPEFDPASHLFIADPSDGALGPQALNYDNQNCCAGD